MRQLANVGETAAKLTPNVLADLPNAKQARGMRNFLVHAYDQVNFDIVWNTATENIPALRDTVEAYLLNHATPLTQSSADEQSIVEEEVVQRYDSSLLTYIGAKSEQVDRIEQKLEAIIQTQQREMDQLQRNKPSILTKSSIRNQWQQDISRRKSICNRLTTRLEFVRELKEEVDVLSSKLEALAEQKLRKEEPELARRRDTILKKLRQTQVEQIKQSHNIDREKRQDLGRSQE